MEDDPLAELRNRLYSAFVKGGGAIKLQALLSDNRYRRALVIARMGNLPDAYELLKKGEEKRPFVSYHIIEELIYALRLHLRRTKGWSKFKNQTNLELVLEMGYEAIARDMTYGIDIGHRYQPWLMIYRYTKNPQDLEQARKYRKHASWVGYDGCLGMLISFANQTESNDDWLKVESFLEKNLGKISHLVLVKYWCAAYRHHQDKGFLEKSKDLADTETLSGNQEEAEKMWRVIAQTTHNPRYYWKAKAIRKKREAKELEERENTPVSDWLENGYWPENQAEWERYAEYLLSQELPDMKMVVETFLALFAND